MVTVHYYHNQCYSHLNQLNEPDNCYGKRSGGTYGVYTGVAGQINPPPEYTRV